MPTRGGAARAAMSSSPTTSAPATGVSAAGAITFNRLILQCMPGGVLSVLSHCRSRQMGFEAPHTPSSIPCCVGGVQIEWDEPAMTVVGKSDTGSKYKTKHPAEGRCLTLAGMLVPAGSPPLPSARPCHPRALLFPVLRAPFLHLHWCTLLQSASACRACRTGLCSRAPCQPGNSRWVWGCKTLQRCNAPVLQRMGQPTALVAPAPFENPHSRGRGVPSCPVPPDGLTTAGGQCGPPSNGA